MSYSGTGAPPGAITYVLPGDSAAVIQSKLDSVQAGNSLVFTGGATYDFGGTTIQGKSGVTVWADGQVVIQNAPGAGTSGAFDFSGQSDWTIGGKAAGQGFVFQGSLVDATNASGNWAIGNCQFNNQASNGFDGAAIRMNGASFGTVINNDFNGVGGNVLGMYSLTNITIDGNHFTNCFEPISIQEPITNDASLGNNIVIQRNVFVGTQRAALEVGPASEGSEHFSGLVISNNFFDSFNNTADPGTLLAISAVGQSAQNTTITNNFIRRGPADAGDVGVAIEMTGTGEVSGNTIANFSYAALTYQSGWNVHGNTVYSDGSSPYFGFVNNGSGSGTFGSETELSGSPATPAMPARLAWGGSIGGAPSGSSTPTVTEKLASDTGVSNTDKVTSNPALNGTADAGAVVHFTIDGKAVTAPATASTGGSWSFTPAGLSDGKHTVVASETNGSGLTGTASLGFTLDKTAPTVASIAASGSGITAGSGTLGAGKVVTLTLNMSEAVTVTGTPTLTLNDGGTATYTGGSGTAALTFSHTVASGQNAADLAVTGFTLGSASIVDGAGNAANLAGATNYNPAGTLQVDTTSTVTGTGTLPKIGERLRSDTGSSATDKITSNAAMTGKTDPGAVIHFTIDGTAIAATATASSNGSWSFTPTGLADGKHTIAATVSNAAGSDTASVKFTLDTTAPTVTEKFVAATATAGAMLSGTGDANAVVHFTVDGAAVAGTATADATGAWAYSAATLGVATGSHTVLASETDLAGNTGTASVSMTPTTSGSGSGGSAGVTYVSLASDSGSSSTDKITNNATLNGTADPNAPVHFTIDGAAAAATTAANSAGAWSFTPAGLTDGKHTVVASETGATSTASLTFTLDTHGPVAVLNSAVLANGQVTLTGSTDGAGDTVQVYEGYTLIGSAQTKSDGSFTVVGSASPDAYHEYGAVAVDAAGNWGAGSNAITPTTGTAAAATMVLASSTSASLPSVGIGLAHDTGASASDLITSDSSLKGTGDAGTSIHLVVDGSAIAATPTVDSTGAWSFSPSALGDGQHVIEALETNGSGITAAAFLTFTLDAQAAVPNITGVALANGQATLTGTTGEVGDSVNVYDGSTWLGTTPTGTDGAWHYTANAAPNAVHVYGVFSVDPAGHYGGGLNKLVLGSTSADTLTGSAGGDVIIGNGGNDTIIGGTGADILTGGSGKVTFAYNAVSDSAPGASDIITDFHSGSSKIDFTNIAGIGVSNGVPQFQGNITGAGNLALNAHSVAYLEVGNSTQILVNTSNASETVRTSDVHEADMVVTLSGINLGISANDLHHA